MVLNLVYILLGFVFLLAAYLIGVKKNLNVISLFMLGFTEGLVEGKNKQRVSAIYSGCSLMVAFTFWGMGIIRLISM
ncbi:hypothetical protein [Alkalihalobacillus pseudalcaliphilus]|uniref:hypothetical protein n=1 Tax=Alkalihalobacillus pseudalcaliphilus TaxID=79884 RepID=UPI00064DFF11|nr:hypothetical protein [Alkalihalobacillus pseudalcaliphilus]KMK76820.1 hypothetical protein AB990_07900 [Alkalihalobacillus pseudalcaliphilus]